MATKKKSYADEARSIMNKYKLRLGDKFDKGDVPAMESMNAELASLRERQEGTRMIQLGGKEYCSGGKLKKMATGGKLPMYAGPGELPNWLRGKRWDQQVLGMGTTPNLDYFAYGDTRFGNQLPFAGGMAPSSSTPFTPSRSFDYNPNYKPNNFHLSLGNEPNYLDQYYDAGVMPETTITAKKPATKSAATPSLPAIATVNPWTEPTIDPYDLDPKNLEWTRRDTSAGVANRGLAPIVNDTIPGPTAPAPTGDTPYKSRVPWMGAAAGVIGGLLMNKKLDLPSYDYQEYKPGKLAPHLVDYSRGREQTMRERDIADARIRRGARGTGSQAGLIENILAGTTGTQRVAGTALNQSLENEQNVNANILNEVAARNAQMEMSATEMNARNRLYASQIERENALLNEQQRQNRIGSIMDSITGYGKDLLAANKYDQMLQMIAPDNYTPYATKDSKLRRIFQISADMGLKHRKSI